MSSSEGRSEHDADAEVERQLTTGRPLPAASFRGELRRGLLEPQAPAPPRLRLLIGAYAGSGGLLLAAVALGIAGAGPFGA
jgi:hypothetical protein